MTPLTPQQLARLRELEADELLDQLSVEERAELDELRDQSGTGPADRYDTAVSRVVLSVAARDAMPADVRARLQNAGRQFVAARAGGDGVAAGRLPTSAPPAGPTSAAPGRRRSPWVPMLVAASVVLAGAAAFLTYQWNREREARERQTAQFAIELTQARQENARVLADAAAKIDEWTRRATESEGKAAELDRQRIADAAKLVDLGRQLAEATNKLDDANLQIAKFQTPQDPALLAQTRRKLLDMAGTVTIAWQPFDLPDAPAEQRQVAGDVIWNDQLKQGFLRFVGLKANDPTREQYQVWVIDERGMEQKVSGGVFNATAQGEVIVPIHPGIDVRRVSLFAVTIEEPGGTWVPDLKRRVVVAPRGNG